MLAKSFVERVGIVGRTVLPRQFSAAASLNKQFSDSTSNAWTPPVELGTPPKIRKQFTVFQEENTIIPPFHLKKLCDITGKTPQEHFAASPKRLAWHQTITKAMGFQCDGPEEFHDNVHKLWHHMQPVIPTVNTHIMQHFLQQRERISELFPSNKEEAPAGRGILSQNYSLLQRRKESGTNALENPEYFRQVLTTMTALDFYNISARTEMDQLISDTIQNGAKREGLTPLPLHDKDNTVVIVNGAPGSGKSVAWPYFRDAFEKKYDIPWRNFQKVNSDWWRPLLCDRDSLSIEAQPYYERVTNDELCSMTSAVYADYILQTGEPSPHTILEHPFPSAMLLHNALRGNKEENSDHTSVKMVFFVVPPEEIIERVHMRAEKGNPYTRMGKGRHALVSETLERYQNTLADKENELIQTLNQGCGHDVEIKILDKDVPLGMPPKPVLIGNLGTGIIDIYDVRTLILMGKYSRINTDATCAEELYNTHSQKIESQAEYFDHFKHISQTLNFVDKRTKTTYAAHTDGIFTVLDETLLNEKMKDPYHAFAFNRLSNGVVAPNIHHIMNSEDATQEIQR